jgi:ribosomal protein L34E
MQQFLGLRRSKQTGRVPLNKININLVRKTDTLNWCAICNAAIMTAIKLIPKFAQTLLAIIQCGA